MAHIASLQPPQDPGYFCKFFFLEVRKAVQRVQFNSGDWVGWG